MGVDVISDFNTIDTSHALRASERATQLTVRFQTAYRLTITASLDWFLANLSDVIRLQQLDRFVRAVDS